MKCHKTWNVIRQINKDDSINQRFSPYPNSPFLKILDAKKKNIVDTIKYYEKLYETYNDKIM